MGARLLSAFGLVLIVVASLQVSARTWTEQELRCGAGVYCAEEMVCLARVNNPPKGMHSDYYLNIVSIKAFKSVKNLASGEKTLVDSLVISEDPAGDTPGMNLDEAKRRAQFEWGFYTHPAYQNGQSVRFPGNTFEQPWDMQIVSSEVRADHRLDKLVGARRTVDSVVGDYVTDFECEAKVVEKPSRIDDLTN